MTEALDAITAAQLIAWITLGAAIVAGVRRTWPILARLQHLLDDLQGEAARPGVPARPGLLERLALAEEQLSDIATSTGTRFTSLEARLEAVERTLATLQEAHAHA